MITKGSQIIFTHPDNYFDIRIDWEGTSAIESNYTKLSVYMMVETKDSYKGSGFNLTFYNNYSGRATYMNVVNNVTGETETTELFRNVDDIYTIRKGQAAQLVMSNGFDLYHPVNGVQTFSVTGFFTCGALGKFYSGAFDTGEIVITIPRDTEIVAATNFTDLENPTIQYRVKDAGTVNALQAAISLDGETAHIQYRDIPIDTTSYTFNLTADERNVLRDYKKTSTSIPVYYLIKTVRQANSETATFISSLEKILTIVTEKPTIAPTVVESNTNYIALTGSNKTIIKHHNNVQYEINATASKGATITHQQVTCGNKSSTAESGTLQNVESNLFVFTVSDSYDNISSNTVTLNMVEYVPLTCNIAAENTTTDGVVRLTIKGNYFNGSFGRSANNLTVKYRYKVNSAEFGAWQEITPTVKDNTYSINYSLSGLNYADTYTFEATAADVLESVTSAQVKAKGQPVFDWSETDFNFNVPVTYTENGKEYSISNAAKAIDGVSAAELAKMAGLIKSMGQRYTLNCEVYPSNKYSNVQVNMYLYGNIVNGYISAQRKETAAAGDIANEVVCQIEFGSDGKIIGFGSNSFSSGAGGGVATFQMTDTYIYPNDGSVSPEMVGWGRFNVQLCATASAGDAWNCDFCFPVRLDLTKF